jgi:sulfur carrier protein
VKIKLNGESVELPVSVHKVTDLIQWKSLKDSQGIAVAVNECVVLKDHWPKQIISENDSVLIIEATQGG